MNCLQSRTLAWQEITRNGSHLLCKPSHPSVRMTGFLRWGISKWVPQRLDCCYEGHTVSQAHFKGICTFVHRCSGLLLNQCSVTIGNPDHLDRFWVGDPRQTWGGRRCCAWEFTWPWPEHGKYSVLAHQEIWFVQPLMHYKLICFSNF